MPRQAAAQQRRPPLVRADLDEMRRLELHKFGPHGRRVHVAIEFGGRVGPGEAGGVIRVPRIGVRRPLGIEFDKQFEDAAAGPQPRRLLKAGQRFALVGDQPSADNDLAQFRPVLCNDHFVGRHDRVGRLVRAGAKGVARRPVGPTAGRGCDSRKSSGSPRCADRSPRQRTRCGGWCPGPASGTAFSAQPFHRLLMDQRRSVFRPAVEERPFPLLAAGGGWPFAAAVQAKPIAGQSRREKLYGLTVKVPGSPPGLEPTRASATYASGRGRGGSGVGRPRPHRPPASRPRLQCGGVGPRAVARASCPCSSEDAGGTPVPPIRPANWAMTARRRRRRRRRGAGSGAVQREIGSRCPAATACFK